TSQLQAWARRSRRLASRARQWVPTLRWRFPPPPSWLAEQGRSPLRPGTLTLQARDRYGNALTTGGQIVTFPTSGGSSTGQLSATSDNGDGTYSATFSAIAAGTATTIGATIDGVPVTSTLPTVTVVAGTPAQLTVVAGADQQASAGSRV